MHEKVFPIFQKYLKPRVPIIIGVSGGPDSMALLDLLNKFSKQTPLTIIVAHVNHGLRGRAALHDETLVKTISKSYGISSFVKRVKLAGKSHFEEHGRKIRRAFFEALREKFSAQWILTAHTQDDQVETIVFNFFRGSGPRGLAGMQLAAGFYLKPLLGVSKSEILHYLKIKKIKFCLDRTNEDTRFRRNFIRKKMFPLCEKLNPSFRTTLLRNAEIFRSLEVWLQDEAFHFLTGQKEGAKDGFLFHARDFQKLPASVKATVLQIAFQSFSRQPYRLSHIRIQEILRMIHRHIGRKKIILGKYGAFIFKNGNVFLSAPGD